MNNGRSLAKPPPIWLNVGHFPDLPGRLRGETGLMTNFALRGGARLARHGPAQPTRVLPACAKPELRFGEGWSGAPDVLDRGPSWRRRGWPRCVNQGHRISASKGSWDGDLGHMESNAAAVTPDPRTARRARSTLPPDGRCRHDRRGHGSVVARRGAPANAQCRSTGPAWPGDGWPSCSLPLPGTREYRASRRLPRLVLGEESSGTPWRGSRRRKQHSDGFSAQRTTR